MFSSSLVNVCRPFFLYCTKSLGQKLLSAVFLLFIAIPQLNAQVQHTERGSSTSQPEQTGRKAPKNTDPNALATKMAMFTTGYNAALFETRLEGPNCFAITSMTLSSVAPATQVGTFTNGIAAGLSIDEGIILTTGTVTEAFTDNSSTGISEGTFNAAIINDPDLDALAATGFGTHDEAILEVQFTVTAGVDGFSIPFQFAGDEYPEYVCSQFNDVFAVFIDGPGLGGFQQISLVPGTSNPISVNNLNGGACGAFSTGEPADLSQSALFIDNNDGTPGGPIISEYDGFTVSLNATQGGLTPGTYTLKLAIGDLVDSGWDSGVFFGSMQASSGGVPVDCACLTNPLSDPTGDCDNDGLLNGNEADAAAALNPCVPDPLAIGTGDCDNDGTLNQDETDAVAALDPCDPDPLGFNFGDCDNDGTFNGLETDAAAALNPCDPNPLAFPLGDCDGDGIQNMNDNCPLLFGIAPHGCSDNDLDGHIDSDDLDDDNDGILDSFELCGTPIAPLGSTIDITIDLDNFEDEVTWNITDPNGTVVANGGPYLNGDDIITSSYAITEYGEFTFSIFDFFDDGLSFSGGTSNENATSSYSVDFNGNNVFTSVAQPDFGSRDDITIPVNLFTCLSSDPSSDDDNDGIYNYQDLDYAIANGSTLNGNGVIALLDTDGDGQIDTFDNDSDDEGCFDAIEGSASFDPSNTDATGMLLGTIDLNGVPTIAGISGQDIGTSQDNTTHDALCAIEAVTDHIDVIKNTTTAVFVLNNDIFLDPPGSIMANIVSASKTGAGVSVDMATGVSILVYDPVNEYLGADTIIYQIQSPGGITDNDTVFINVFSPLPIDLLSFDAVANPSLNRIDLKWVTATEINNEKFIIRRSQDLQDWEEIIETPGAGNSTHTIAYSDVDDLPLSGVSFYQLRQIDFDGQYSDSQVRAVDFNADLDLSIFPNPSNDQITILDPEMSLHQLNDLFHIRMFDSRGREFGIPITPHEGRFVISVKHLSPGSYILEVRQNHYQIQIQR